MNVLLALSPRRVLCSLASLAILLALMGGLAIHLERHVESPGVFTKELIRLFDLNLEGNVPTWYSTLLLALAAGLFLLIAREVKARGRRFRRHWQALGCVFLALSLDEAASIHEILNEPLRALLGTKGIFFFAWVLPYGFLSLLLGFAFLRFFLGLPGRTRFYFAISAVLLVGGAAGMELAEGWWVDRYGWRGLGLSLMTLVEELLEMLGASVLIHALLEYVRLELGEGGGVAA